MKDGATPAADPASEFLEEVVGAWPGRDAEGANVIRSDGVPVGAFSLRKVARDAVRLDGLHIDEAHRRQGHAGRLLEGLRRIADRTRCRITLEAFRRPDLDGGGPIMALYAGHGFRAASGPDEQGYVEMERTPAICGAGFESEGAPPSWWRVTGRLEPSLAVLEETIDPGLLADAGAAAPDLPDALRSWFSDIVDRLAGSEDLTRLPLNPDLVATGSHRTRAPLEILLCSRASMDGLLGAEGALGVHLIGTPDGDPFGEASDLATAHRIAMVWEPEEFLRLVTEEAALDMDPAHHLEAHVGAWLVTLFHEIEHVRLFAQNSALLAPADLAMLSDGGTFDHDLFDCSTGYGIRPLQDETGTTVWADTIHEARRQMEEHVEARGQRLMWRVAHTGLGPRDFLEAYGLEDRILQALTRPQDTPAGAAAAGTGSSGQLEDGDDPEDLLPSP